MGNAFNEKEKKNYMLKKHIKNNLFQYILDIVGPMVFTLVLLYLCKAEDIIYGIILSLALSCGKILYDFNHYKKTFLHADKEQ